MGSLSPWTPPSHVIALGGAGLKPFPLGRGLVLHRAEGLWGLRTGPGVIQGQALGLAAAQLWPSRPCCACPKLCAQPEVWGVSFLPLSLYSIPSTEALKPISSSSSWPLVVLAQQLYIPPACPSLLSPFILHGNQA